MSAAMKFTLSMAIFGSIGYFSAKTNLPAIELVFIRCICACVVLSIVYLFSQRKKEVADRKEIGYSVLFESIANSYYLFYWNVIGWWNSRLFVFG